MSRRRRMPPEYVKLSLSRVGELEAGEQAIRDLAGALQVPQPGHQYQVLPPGEGFVHGRELPGEADGLPHVRRLRGDVEAIDGSRARVRLEQRGQDIHGRGLACAIGAEQGEDAARATSKRVIRSSPPARFALPATATFICTRRNLAICSTWSTVSCTTAARAT